MTDSEKLKSLLAEARALVKTLEKLAVVNPKHLQQARDLLRKLESRHDEQQLRRARNAVARVNGG